MIRWRRGRPTRDLLVPRKSTRCIEPLVAAWLAREKESNLKTPNSTRFTIQGWMC
jgi:hypothetical protein